MGKGGVYCKEELKRAMDSVSFDRKEGKGSLQTRKEEKKKRKFSPFRGSWSIGGGKKKKDNPHAVRKRKRRE